MIKTIIAFSLSIIVTGVFGGEYLVQPGDTLSGILYRLVPGKIYNQNLQATLKLNPNISNPDIISPGMVITLPKGVGKVTQLELKRPITKERAPASIERKIKKEQFFFINVRGLTGGINLQSVDQNSGAREVAISNFGYGAEVELGQKITTDLTLSYITSIRQFDFEVAKTKALEKSKVKQFSTGISLDYMFRSNSTVYSRFSLEDSFILNSIDSTKLELDKVLFPQYELGLRYELIRFENDFGFDIEMYGGLLFPTPHPTYDIQSGYYGGGMLSSHYRGKGTSLQIGLGYKIKKIDLNVAEQLQRELLFRCGISWDF